MTQGLGERDNQPRHQRERRRGGVVELDLDRLCWVTIYRNPLSLRNLVCGEVD